MEWNEKFVFFSRADVLKIHKIFAHPPAEKLAELQKRAHLNQYTSTTKTVLEDIVRRCNSCQRMAPKPSVFQVTMPDNIQFNHEIILDPAWIEPRPRHPVLRIVYRGTHFSAARFVDGECAESVWNIFVSIWVTVYVVFPNFITHDFGSCFTSNFFKNNSVQFGIIPKEIPCESNNSMGSGERYHAPLRRIYKKLKVEYSNLNNPTTLAIAVHGLNKTANPEGLLPTLLVFGTKPKIPLGNVEHLAPTQRERFSDMELARREIERIVAKERIALAKKTRTKGMNVFGILPGSEVLVHREKNSMNGLGLKNCTNMMITRLRMLTWEMESNRFHYRMYAISQLLQ